MTKERNLEDAKRVLSELGMPKQQLNERTALCLLALLSLLPNKKWRDAESPLIGITPIMDWAREHYGKDYKPNTRETIRRQSLHQFIEAGVCLYNPDKPDRAVNSPLAVYQIEPNVLKVLRLVGTKSYKAALAYVGDTGDKYGFFDEALLAELGVKLDSHGKLPDLLIYQRDRNWLLLIESVTSHGPVESKRQIELAKLFKGCSAGLVYVSAFPNRKIFLRYLDVIAWESEVWIADAPTHMIHFNGSRFLGPY